MGLDLIEAQIHLGGGRCQSAESQQNIWGVGRSVRLSVRPAVQLSVFLSVCLFVCLSGGSQGCLGPRFVSLYA